MKARIQYAYDPVTYRVSVRYDPPARRGKSTQPQYASCEIDGWFRYGDQGLGLTLSQALWSVATEVGLYVHRGRLLHGDEPASEAVVQRVLTDGLRRLAAMLNVKTMPQCVADVALAGAAPSAKRKRRA